MKTIYIILTAGLLSLSSNLLYSQGSGWLQEKGKTKMSLYYGRYDAQSYRNKAGDKIDYSDNGKFSSDYFKLSAEHGIAPDINIYTYIPVVYNSLKNNLGSSSKFSLGDIEAGVMANVIKGKNTYLVGSLAVTAPLYSKNSEPSVGLGLFSGLASLKLCGTLDPSYKLFYSAETGLRMFTDGTPWWSNSISLGYHLNSKHSLIFECNSIKTFDKGVFSEVPSANRSNSVFVKGSIGYLYQPTQDLQIGANLWHDIYNRNTSIGKGGALLLMYTF